MSAYTGSQNWMTNDTLVVTTAASIAYAGRHLITELTSDSLNITFHIENQSNSWLNRWHKK